MNDLQETVEKETQNMTFREKLSHANEHSLVFQDIKNGAGQLLTGIGIGMMGLGSVLLMMGEVNYLPLFGLFIPPGLKLHFGAKRRAEEIRAVKYSKPINQSQSYACSSCSYEE